MSHNKRYIPLNAGESAVLPEANTLLPRNEVYEPLAQMIIDAVNKAEAAESRSLNELREHNAISIDGERGTGKTAVLVNLKSYLNQDEHKSILSKVHILDPVDPTLLENGESLFLHIIVAAVLHDKDVKEQQRNKPDKARSLNQTLEKLAQSLESVETQQDRYGMDKVRAMFSNKQLADCVQDFFREVLGLLGKQLLILPIDDVDTSLNRAFENLEIVRRYLATPYVLPIVCGDRKLYNDVTWRDFHGRLTKDSSYRRKEAYDTAVLLAAEYQRKTLPFPRRLTMPEVSRYWQQSNIYLRDDKPADVMPLRNFIAWLEIFLAGPVNGLGDSQLSLPIPSMRALTQLLNRCHQLIPALPKAVKEADSTLQVKRAWQMPDVPVKAIEEFEKEYQQRHKDQKREYGSAYTTFAKFSKPSSAVDASTGEDNVDRKKWLLSLEKHFKFEPAGGAAYLVLLASKHWQQWQDAAAGQHSGSVFDTPLFQPRMHGNVNYQHFERKHDLSDWEGTLKDKLPKVWFRDLSGLKTILPYPLAEVGSNINKDLQKQLSYSRNANNQNWLAALGKVSADFTSNELLSRKAGLLLNLLAEHYFYTTARRTVLLNIGRIFELIITSLLGDVELIDLQRILHSAPFFSAKSQVQDIAVSEQQDVNDGDQITDDSNDEEVEDPLDLALSDLQQEIAQWRKDYSIAELDVSPWLIYKVFEKVYAMVSDNGNRESDLAAALNKAGLVFYATWSAFGSFEKGRLFGLPELTTGVGLHSAKNFESNEHFKMNIGHLAPRNNQLPLPDMKTAQERKHYGAGIRSITYVLTTHPLRKWIDEIPNLDKVSTTSSEPPMLGKTASKVGLASKPKAWLCEKLGLNTGDRLTEFSIAKAIEDWSQKQCHNLFNDMETEYPKATERSVLKKALQNKFPGQF
ncbi:antiviral RADAR system adenosine triphosphatase RdrA [Aeromonas veronii]|uniref:antiviral RADAR system adenosine triphosphatase RdrA n=2 Tax=Aeromonas TaxID=642 RepID=UPI0011A64E76|nr:antiviral RADAR system adenosine triphosphatase RdrA [Aeromonas veronii]